MFKKPYLFGSKSDTKVLTTVVERTSQVDYFVMTATVVGYLVTVIRGTGGEERTSIQTGSLNISGDRSINLREW